MRKVIKSKRIIEILAKYITHLIARNGMLAQRLALSNPQRTSSSIKSPPHSTSTFPNQNHLNQIYKQVLAARANRRPKTLRYGKIGYPPAY